MYPALIQWFVTVVPMCSLVTPMHSILRLMESDPSAQILVIDKDKKPLGVVACHELLLGVVYSHPLMYGQSLCNQIASNQGKLTAVCSVLADTGNLASGHTLGNIPEIGTQREIPVTASTTRVLSDSVAKESLQSCLEALTRAKGRSPLQPIVTIPAYASLEDFRSQFMTRLPMIPTPGASPLEWVVVDKQDKVIGLVNQQQVWRALALSTVDTPPLQGRLGHVVTPPLPAQGADVSDGPTLPLKEIDFTPVFSPGQEVAEGHPTSEDSIDGVHQALLQRLEEAQIQLQSLRAIERQHEKQLQFKDELLEHVSHELKTPLTALVGLSELITLHAQSTSAVEKSKQTRLLEKQERYAHLMHHSSHQLMALMTILFDLIHIETGQLVLVPQAVDIEALLEDAYQYAWQNDVISQKHHTTVSSVMSPASVDAARLKREVVLDIDKPLEHGQGAPLSRSPSAPSLRIDNQSGIEHITVDDHHFRRLWISLLLNALQLTKAEELPPTTRGRVTKEQPAMTREQPSISITSQGNWIVLKLRHRGPSIPPQQQARIFESVDIADDNPNVPFKDVGVRLLLALRLSEEHGGTLTWISHEAMGFEVAVLVPRHTVDAKKQYSLPSEPSQTADHKGFVIIADSDPERVFQLFEAVSQLGYEVAIARSGAEALKKVRCLNPQAILLDLSMPYDSEKTLCSVLNQKTNLQSLPIIATVSVASGPPDKPCLQFPLDLEQLDYQLSQSDLGTITQERTAPLMPTTILYLNPYATLVHAASKEKSVMLSPEAYCLVPSDLAELNAILHPHHYRVIEVDSPEQAELLTRVWHPDVMIIGGIQPRSSPLSSYGPSPSAPPHSIDGVLRQALVELKTHAELAELPIVTVTKKETDVAFSLGLQVFPCPFLSTAAGSNHVGFSVADLSKVIQLAIASRSRN